MDSYVYSTLVAAEVIYGVWLVLVGQVVHNGFSPLALAWYRMAGSSLLLLIVSRFLEGPIHKHLGSTTLALGSTKTASRPFPWTHFLVLGALMSANILGNVLGVSHTTSTQAALMQPLIPVVACAAGVGLGRERLSLGKLIGILCSVAGALLVVWSGAQLSSTAQSTEGYDFQMGTLALMVQVVGAALYFVLQKELLHRFPPMFITSVTTGIATMYLSLGACLLFKDAKASMLQGWVLTTERKLALLYAICLTTSLNLVIFARATKLTAASTVTAFATLQPLTTATITAVCFSVYPSHAMLCGGVAIVGGLLLTVKAQMQ